MKNEDRARRLLKLDERLLLAAELAVEEAISMISNPKTPPSAKAAVMGQVFRANGLHDGKSGDDREKEPHEMTLEEIQSRLALLRREAADRAIPILEGVSARRRDPQPEKPPVATAPSGVFG